MASRWSRQELSMSEHADLQADCMSLDSTGEWVVLAGKRQIALFPLSATDDVTVRPTKTRKWEVSSVQWSPTKRNSHLFALSSNDVVEIWNVSPQGKLDQRSSLSGHYRTITDLAWSPFEPHFLATCSIDSNVLMWDIREPRKPSTCFPAVSYATQVKFNPLDANLLASSHDGDLRIWDIRKPLIPIRYISAHMSTIHGIDWNPATRNHISSASQDCSVNIFDITASEKPAVTLQLAVPIYRACYLPLGLGLLTVLVSHLRHSDNSIFLWNLTQLSEPVHTFSGHSDAVLNIAWKTCCPGESFSPDVEHQLVTWSRDSTLRVWRLDQELLAACASDVGRDSDADSVQSNGHRVQEGENPNPCLCLESAEEKASQASSGREVVLATDEERARNRDILKQEFSTVGLSASGMEVKEVSVEKRFCILAFDLNGEEVEIEVNFPVRYPRGSGPNFRILSPLINSPKENEEKAASSGSSRDKDKEARHSGEKSSVPSGSLGFQLQAFSSTKVKQKVIQILEETAAKYTSRNKVCLEPCLRRGRLLLQTLSAKHAQFSSENASKLIKHRSSFNHKMASSPQNQNVVAWPTADHMLAPGFTSHLYRFGNFQDSNIPFPQACGARFSGPGYLVVFGRLGSLKRYLCPDGTLPRSLSGIGGQPKAGGRGPFVHNAVSGMTSPLGRDPSQGYGSSVPRRRGGSPVSAQRRRTSWITEEGGARSEGTGSPVFLAPETTQNWGLVFVYDTRVLLPYKESLARRYSLEFSSNCLRACRRNAEVAKEIGNEGLSQVWEIAGRVSSYAAATWKADEAKRRGMAFIPVAYHPCGRQLINSFIDHFMRRRDVQSAAMLACAFTPNQKLGAVSEALDFQQSSTCEAPPGPVRPMGRRRRTNHSRHSEGEGRKQPPLNPSQPRRPASSLSIASAYHTVHGDAGWSVTQHLPSPSAEEAQEEAAAKSFDESHLNEIVWIKSLSKPAIIPTEVAVETSMTQEDWEANQVLDPRDAPYHDLIKAAYADLLFRWRMLEHRSQVMQYVVGERISWSRKDFEACTRCPRCGRERTGPGCPSVTCARTVNTCALCHVVVKGLGRFCLHCFHGGHLTHVTAWFKDGRNTVCPAPGCLCNCPAEMKKLQRG